MKFNLFDVPVNVLDGVEKYPNVSICVAAFSLGWIGSAIVHGNPEAIFIGVALLVGYGVIAYFLGKPK